MHLIYLNKNGITFHTYIHILYSLSLPKWPWHHTCAGLGFCTFHLAALICWLWNAISPLGSVRYSTIQVRCRYYTVNFRQNIHNRHPIARPSGRGMGCLLWVWSLIQVLLLLLQWRGQYRDKLDRVITALDCICYEQMHRVSVIVRHPQSEHRH